MLQHRETVNKLLIQEKRIGFKACMGMYELVLLKNIVPMDRFCIAPCYNQVVSNCQFGFYGQGAIHK